MITQSIDIIIIIYKTSLIDRVVLKPHPITKRLQMESLLDII